MARRTVRKILNLPNGKFLDADVLNRPEEEVFLERRKLEEAVQRKEKTLVCAICQQALKIRGDSDVLVPFTSPISMTAATSPSRIEELSNSIWCPDGHSRWFYERGRGSYRVAFAREGTTPARVRKFKERTPPSQSFCKTDLARYVNAWDQKPNMLPMGIRRTLSSSRKN